MSKRSKSRMPFWMKSILFLFFCGVAAAAFLLYLNSPVDEEGKDRIFIVEEGEILSTIASDLEAGEYIRSQYLFRGIQKISKDNRSIKTGSYKLSSAQNTWQIYQDLLSGKQELVSITIPEGWTLRQIAELLDRRGVTSYDGFMDAARDQEILESLKIPGENIQGYLFPDTYNFPRNYEPYYILQLFLKNFRDKMDEIYPDWFEMTEEQLYDKIIMASIVEREYRAEEEAPMIASVFYNRLDSWYPRLESCATVTYIITEVLEKPHPERLTDQDIQVDSPYNTYENSGLPPGPIANPGSVALKAAFYPAKTDYIYFVVKDVAQGTHNFSSDYEDFMVHKNQYLRSYRSK